MTSTLLSRIPLFPPAVATGEFGQCSEFVFFLIFCFSPLLNMDRGAKECSLAKEGRMSRCCTFVTGWDKGLQKGWNQGDGGLVEPATAGLRTASPFSSSSSVDPLLSRRVSCVDLGGIDAPPSTHRTCSTKLCTSYVFTMMVWVGFGDLSLSCVSTHFRESRK